MIAYKDWKNSPEKRQKALRKLDRKVLLKLVVEWAYSVLHIFENQFPDDNRPRKAIEAAETSSSFVAAAAAWAAAHAAVHAAYASDAARANAAYAAAWAAADAAWDAHAVIVVANVTSADNNKWEWTYKTYINAMIPDNFNKVWINSIAKDLIETVKEDYSAMRILTDCLEENGCTKEILFQLKELKYITKATWIFQV